MYFGPYRGKLYTESNELRIALNHSTCVVDLLRKPESRPTLSKRIALVNFFKIF